MTSFYIQLGTIRKFLNFFGSATCLRCNRIRKNHVSNVKRTKFHSYWKAVQIFSLSCLCTQFWLFLESVNWYILSVSEAFSWNRLSWKLACNYCRFSTSSMSRFLMSGGFQKPLFCGPPHSTIVLGSIVLFIRKKRDFSKGLWHTSPWKTSFYCLSFNKQVFLNFFVSAVCLWCNRIRNKTGTSKVGAISKAQKAQKRIFFFQKMSHCAEKCKSGTLWALLTFPVAKYHKTWKRVFLRH